MSSRAVIRCGKPQGSNLGPLFILVYVNDLLNRLSFSYADLFADDTNLTTGGKCIDIQNHLNDDLEKVHYWLLANKLKLNTEKNECMLIGSRQRVKDNQNNL